MEADLYHFLSDADYPSTGKRPASWHGAVKGLRNEMTTHAIIVAAAHLFCIEITIVDWQGVCILICYFSPVLFKCLQGSSFLTFLAFQDLINCMKY